MRLFYVIKYYRNMVKVVNILGYSRVSILFVIKMYLKRKVYSTPYLKEKAQQLQDFIWEEMAEVCQKPKY